MGGSSDNTVRLWNENGECITHWDTESKVRCMTVWNDMLCTGADSGEIILWKDPNLHRHVLSAYTYGSNVWGLAVCGDHLFQALLSINLHDISGYGNGWIYKWTVKGCVWSWKADTESVLALTGTNKELVTSSGDGTINRWTLDGELLQSYICHPGDVPLDIKIWNGMILSSNQGGTSIQWTGDLCCQLC